MTAPALPAAPVLAALAAALLAAAAAQETPQAPSRALSPERLAACRRAAAIDVQVPAQTMELGSKSELYRCWRLRLTGQHGIEAQRLLERMRAVQEALRRLLEAYDGDVRRREEGAEGPALRERLRATEDGLERLLRHYEEQRRDGVESGLIREARRGLFGGEPTLAPNLRQDDYTMIYDASIPGCPARAPEPR